MHISGDIQKIIGNQKCVIDTVGKSDSQVLCFENMVLKIESKNDKSDNERDLLSWLVDKLPKVGGFIDL